MRARGYTRVAQWARSGSLGRKFQKSTRPYLYSSTIRNALECPENAVCGLVGGFYLPGCMRTGYHAGRIALVGSKKENGIHRYEAADAV